MKKKLTTILLITTSSLLLLTACSAQKTDNTASNPTSTISSGDVKTTLSKIDNTKWKYNSSDKVYYQIGISYVANKVSDNQTLSIFVPEEYLSATNNGDGTYTATFNTDAKVGNYTSKTAPVVIPINTPGYSSMAALTDYSNEAATYTKEGFIYVSAGLRGRDSGAPAGVTDAKAAIRYLRYNNELVGSSNSIYVYGMSGGGAQSAILGASGDSELYTPYLKEIGAVEGVSDSVDGVMAWCPVTNLDYANEAYEWNMGSARENLSDDSQKLSNSLATEFANYINKLNLKDGNGNTLNLSESSSGIYQSGSYYDYIKSTIEDSLNKFIEDTTFPYTPSSSGRMRGPGGGARSGGAPGGVSRSTPGGTPPSNNSNSSESNSSSSTPIEQRDNVKRNNSSSGLTLSGTYNSVEDYIAALNKNKTWVTYDSNTKKVSITSVADFVSQLKTPSKDLPAFDALDKSQAENQLFGYNSKGAHFDSTLANLLKDTEYYNSYKEDLEKTDSVGNKVQTRVDMYNPMYYLTNYYQGYKESTVAKNWRIRTGINQGDTALSTEVNLSLALKQYGDLNVDFETVWGQGHTEAERTGKSSTNFIKWVKSNNK